MLCLPVFQEKPISVAPWCQRDPSRHWAVAVYHWSAGAFWSLLGRVPHAEPSGQLQIENSAGLDRMAEIALVAVQDLARDPAANNALDLSLRQRTLPLKVAHLPDPCLLFHPLQIELYETARTPRHDSVTITIRTPNRNGRGGRPQSQV